MKRIIKLCLAVCLLAIIASCSKDTDMAEKGDTAAQRKGTEHCTIDKTQLPEEDRIKYSLAEFFNEALQDDAVRTYLLDHLYTTDKDGDDIQNPEFLLAEHLQDEINTDVNSRFTAGQDGAATLQELINDWVSVNDPDQLSLFEELCSHYTDFVLQFPWWAVDLLEDQGGVDQVHLGVIGAIKPVDCDGAGIRVLNTADDAQIINVKAPIQKYIPMYVKNAELHREIFNDAQETLDEIVDNLMIFYEDCTFSEGELLKFIKTIDCSALTFVDYSKMAVFFKKHCSGVRHHEYDCCDGEDNDGDGLIDCDDVDDCPCLVEICNDGCDNDNDGHIDEDDEDCQCTGQYQRDCVVEDNVLVGIKFGEAAWLNICQLHDEGHIHLKLNLDAVAICDQSQGSMCPADDLTDLIVEGLPDKFFEIQKITKDHPFWDPSAILYQDNILWMSEDEKEYWKVFPLYVSLRKGYLETKMNQWIPSDIGSTINIVAFEIDNSNVSVSDTYSKTITTRHALNAGATIGINELISTNFSYNFDYTKVSSATSVTNISYQKDVFINNYTLHYWDKDEVIPDPTGVEGNTWYGQIPGNSGTGLDGLYLEFRIHD